MGDPLIISDYQTYVLDTGRSLINSQDLYEALGEFIRYINAQALGVGLTNPIATPFGIYSLKETKDGILNSSNPYNKAVEVLKITFNIKIKEEA
jgi:hypothetical protein